MKIAGITMVRNEVDVIEFCLDHHLSQGLDYIFICDNGSTDGTLEYLQERAQTDSKIILYKDDGQFHQQRIINFLSSMAYNAGCEWVVPFDADEIWFSKNTLAEDLKNINNSAVRVKLTDFIQSSAMLDPRKDTYETVNWRCVTDIKPTLDEISNGSRSMLENPSFYKYIVKTSPNLSIAPGAHSFSGQSQDYSTDENFAAYHIPLRSYVALRIKAEQGQRLIDAGYPEGHGWHVQRYAKQFNSGYLIEEWQANSETDGKMHRLDGTVVKLVFDDSVSSLYKKYKNGK
jgi:glycosyltransferase involved in cell wall biosynthesis